MEWKGFYQVNKMRPFLIGLVFKLYRWVRVPKEPSDIEVEMGTPFHSFLVKVVMSRKRKTGAVESSKVDEEVFDVDVGHDDAPPS